eukprot:TRINITY_DN25323_c0_g1_i2.p1 TRINITY_DN25323_c0_g1~~TRINITY_DN25323_c0_g1_i2.p1  ORF type:complete len:109 (-),score=10.93 TRINITY_DN25323_c0_g1_i2:43-369(-)
MKEEDRKGIMLKPLKRRSCDVLYVPSSCSYCFSTSGAYHNWQKENVVICGFLDAGLLAGRAKQNLVKGIDGKGRAQQGFVERRISFQPARAFSTALLPAESKKHTFIH